MIGVKTTYQDNSKAVTKAAEKATFSNLRHAVASMRKDAARSIRRRKNKDLASPAGTPPFTHVGFAKQALRWWVGDNEALMGFTHSKFGTVGATHEFGLREDDRDYPARPTVVPALERGIVRMQRDWRSSISR